MIESRWKAPGCPDCNCEDPGGPGGPNCTACSLPASGPLSFYLTHYTPGGGTTTKLYSLPRVEDNLLTGCGSGGGTVDVAWALYDQTIPNWGHCNPLTGECPDSDNNGFFFYCSNRPHAPLEGYSRGVLAGNFITCHVYFPVSGSATCQCSAFDESSQLDGSDPQVIDNGIVSWSCNPLCYVATFDREYDPEGIYQDLKFYVFDPADPPSGAVDICVTVRRPGCVVDDVFTAGDPVEGAEVILSLTGTPVGSPVTTGEDGRACFAVTGDAALYTLTATLAGCEASCDVLAVQCGGDANPTLILCCAKARLRVVEAGDDPEDPVLLPGSTVTLPGHSPVVVGMDAIAEFDLTTAEMLAYGPGGSGCNTRSVGPFTVVSPSGEGVGSTHFYRCNVYIDVDCGDDEETEPEDVPLTHLDPDTVFADPAHPSCCGPDDCEQPGPEGRDVAHGIIDVIWDWEFRNYITGASIPGYGPQTWSGSMALDLAHFAATGQAIYNSDCIDVTDLVVSCDEEEFGYAEVRYRRLKLRLVTCDGGAAHLLGRYYTHSSGCNDPPGVAGGGPSCDSGGLDWDFDIDLSEGTIGSGAETNHLCLGEFMDTAGQIGGGGSPDPIFFPYRFRAAGAA